jgi:thiaminase/transcriptional activator TenA
LSYSERLRNITGDIWMRILSHPFIGELGDGSLPMEKYRYYIEQDYAYLLDFSRCLGLAASKADTPDRMGVLSGLMNGCLNYEMGILHGHLVELGRRQDEIASIEMAPTNHAYTRHLLAVAYQGSVGENLSALLPCMWTYQLIGEKLWADKSEGINEHYLEWIKGYRSSEYGALVEKYRDLLDELASECGPSERQRMERHFITSSRYEYMFWDMAYRMEKWPL